MIIEKLFNFLPPSFKDKARKIKEKKSLKQSEKLKQEQIISKETIKELLNSFDISDDLFVHTSLRNIGYALEGGKNTVIEAIKECINLDKNTLLLSALPFRTTMKEYLDNTSFLDMRSAPNAMGVVNNAFMSMPGTLRSLHPTHSAIALGIHAKEYIDEHHLDFTPFSEHSPYYKLWKNGGKILLFGVGLDSMTFTHVPEDMLGENFPFKVYLKKQYIVKVIDFNGNEVEVCTYCHDPKLSAIRNCESIRDYLINAGVMKTKSLGLSEVSLIDAKGYVDIINELLSKGKSIYGKF
ncbi:MAG: AAC(3) family N-acetyltransferase [Bacteroidales bacterium]|jgi:aminoglycoside 3-N-acetyltransferase|nr:AAC(3) family N-acetyltransferase [Bacteroidales bacterium]